MLASPYPMVEREFMEDDDSVPLTDPVDLVGSLMCRDNTRPDICFVVSTLGQFMCKPRQMHWVAAEHVLRYLRGTVGYD